MACAVCFDVRDEDGEVEEGTKGFGGCFYAENDVPYFDAHYMGTIEALGSDSFVFLDGEENNWD